MALLHISRGTLYLLLKARKIPAFRVGRYWRFIRREVDRWRLSERT